MVIEWLKFQIAAESREEFIKKDEQIWTASLATYPGFLGKEVWIAPNIANEVIFAIHWQTREQWKSIPVKDLQAIERRFSQAMGDVSYNMIESKEYQIRKFPEPGR